MPADKSSIIRMMQKDPKRYWAVELFKERGFIRRKCDNCGKFFWSINEQGRCNDVSCKPYEFIGKQITRKRFDYVEAWKSIESFFVDEGHHPAPRNPVVCRWFPGLYFNIASIVNYMRWCRGVEFDLPANPLIVGQPCLRFNDIPQVGVSGRHFTSFVMVGQVASYDGKQGYWKDRCMELDYALLTKVFGIKPDDINFIEDVWLGPAAFGSSLEYHIQGLEVGNAVFTEFEGTAENHKEMKQKIIDMGAGLEKFVWLSQGTPTIYDAVYGNIIDKLKQKCGIEYDQKFFLNYSKLAGRLNMDEVDDIEKVQQIIAKQLGVSRIDMLNKVEPMKAIYSIADHTQTLLYAMTDGGIPSNVGGGYNLRIILRRALDFIEKFSLPIDLHSVMEMHAKNLHEMYPELKDGFERTREVLDMEVRRHKESSHKSRQMIEKLVMNKTSFTTGKLIELYDSHGITPELLSKVAAEHGTQITAPSDFYAKVAGKHQSERMEEKRKDVKGLPETLALYYQDVFEFDAKVIKILEDGAIVLDRTAFYPRGGGQEPDHGEIGGVGIHNVEKVDGVVIHHAENAKLKVGDKVKCKIDKARRERITLHHDATHIINSASRKILGPWLWQMGSKKDDDKAHIDMTHYEMPMPEKIEKIEKLANEVARKDLPITKVERPRSLAERKHGFIIYQGGPIPERILRIASIGDFDVEACGGTHGKRTGPIHPIIITKVERPTDGTVRFVYKAGKRAIEHLEERSRMLDECRKLLGTKGDIKEPLLRLFEEWKKARRSKEKEIKNEAKKQAEELEFGNVGEIRVMISEIKGADIDKLREISKELSSDDTLIFLIGSGQKISLFASAGAKAIKADFNCSELIKRACSVLNGKGGGSASLAQGVAENRDKIKEALKSMEQFVRG